jgi:hypothetical protein
MPCPVFEELGSVVPRVTAAEAKERRTWQDIVKEFAGCADGKG